MTLTFHSDLGDLNAVQQLVVAGTLTGLRAPALRDALPAALLPLWEGILAELKPADDAAETTTWLPRDAATPLAVRLIALPERASRHNTACRPDALLAALRPLLSHKMSALLIALDRPDDALALTLAVQRALPRYSMKRVAQAPKPTAVALCLLTREGPLPATSHPRLAVIAEGVAEAARLVDTPTSELDTDAFVAHAHAIAQQLGVTINVLRADGLHERGMGGLFNVGKAAEREPALVHLSSAGRDPSAPRVAIVGKGIVYDTGGLSLKGKLDMPGMKNDMGGAAAALHAFAAAVTLGHAGPLDVVLCIAENAIGPKALRPDDVITLYSGKTIEVNNTDAEGRLVLSDGVAFAARDLNATIIIDLATLTGAQLVATGRLHAAIVSNDDALEALAVSAGKRSGELVFPLPYAPEFFRREFTSSVADLKNSVKDRANAQSSCAAQFIAESLPDGIRWLHVDLAGPATQRERGTGFGVGLLLELIPAL